MSRYTDYQDVAEDGFVVLDWKHELLSEDGTVIATTSRSEAIGDVMHWGAEISPLNIEPDRLSQQTTSLYLPVDDDSFVPITRSGVLHPDSGNRVRTQAGIVVDGVTTWWTQSTLAIDETEIEESGGTLSASVSLVDAAQPVRSELATAFSWDDGDSVESIVTNLLSTVLDSGDFSIPATGFTALAGDKDAGTSLFSLVTELLEGCGLELIATRTGLVQARTILPSGDDPNAERWRYGDDGIAIDSASRSWLANRYQGWRVEGGSSSEEDPPRTVTVYDLDPSSEGYFSGLDMPSSLGESRYQYASDLSQLRTAAYAQLRRAGLGPGVVSFRTIPNPAMRQGDLIDLSLPSLRAERTCRVIGFQPSIQVDDLMTVRAREIWTPDLDYTVPGLPPELDGIDSFSDDFERANQDLQIIEGGTGGSESWTEIGISWYIQQGLAVQWVPNVWCLAFVNKPLKTYDQYADCYLGNIPSGRWVGPVCRCDGTFSGYVALANRSGVVKLEMWLNGQKEDELGSVSLGFDMSNHSLRVSATGSTIEVLVDLTSHISVTDSRLTGRHVGMNGYGGTGLGAPQVQEFTAGAA